MKNIVNIIFLKRAIFFIKNNNLFNDIIYNKTRQIAIILKKKKYKY